MVTYEQAIRCPRCGKDSDARAQESILSDVMVNGYLVQVGQVSMVTCYCENRDCPYYQRRWYFLIDPENHVLFTTHTPYSQPTI